MAVYVDEIREYPEAMIAPAARARGRRWCHMWADTLPELHEMAKRIGLLRRWFQDKPGFPHYDLVPSKRALAIQEGAQLASLRDHLMKRYFQRKEENDLRVSHSEI